jgi:hypothetical protein
MLGDYEIRQAADFVGLHKIAGRGTMLPPNTDTNRRGESLQNNWSLL